MNLLLARHPPDPEPSAVLPPILPTLPSPGRMGGLNLGSPERWIGGSHTGDTPAPSLGQIVFLDLTLVPLEQTPKTPHRGAPSEVVAQLTSLRYHTAAEIALLGAASWSTAERSWTAGR